MIGMGFTASQVPLFASEAHEAQLAFVSVARIAVPTIPPMIVERLVLPLAEGAPNCAAGNDFLGSRYPGAWVNRLMSYILPTRLASNDCSRCGLPLIFSAALEFAARAVTGAIAAGAYF